ncbi:Peptidyl-prolyl cis-trans isomerase-like 4 [Aphanomyces cochlioides]|nr:Peptidyl-prolyl cis-trans isomerase-like 4 [Aphanomyces cochlioides]
MSVLLQTSLGEVVVDLLVKEAPRASLNFLKLCKIKYYNNVLFFNVQENLLVQSGDPTGTGAGGDSIWHVLDPKAPRSFADELAVKPDLKKGCLCMANTGPDTNTSQFFVTMRDDDLEHLVKHTVFGHVVEGMDFLQKISELYADEKGRPYQDCRILHTFVLDDPFPDPNGLLEPPSSPVGERPEAETAEIRLSVLDNLNEDEGKSEEELLAMQREREAKARGVFLEVVGDIPDADIKPPEEVLFLCKLNPVTTAEDLELIFSRFGPCTAHIILDYKTGDSLCFGFVEFTDKEHCIEAYFKMNGVLIDDRRIKVDFSQSVSKLWNKFNRKDRSITSADQFNDPKRKETMALKPQGRSDSSKYSILPDDDAKRPSKRHRSRSRSRDVDRRMDRSDRKDKHDNRDYDRRDKKHRDDHRDKHRRGSSRSRDRRSRDRGDRRRDR